MNKKKLLMFAIPLLAITLVAAIGYYAIFSASFNVLSAVSITGNLEQELETVYGGETVVGDPINLTNDAPTKREVSLTDDSDGDVNVSYGSELTLSQKVVDFGNESWVLTGDTATVQYIVAGDEFSAEISSGEKPDYVLVYYPDNDDRFINPSEAWPIGIWEIDTLPMEWDYNNGNSELDYNYCLTGEYVTCHGAKLWYVPIDALTLNVEESYDIDWSRADEFLFETKLVQYNSDGNIVIYPGETLTLTPLYEIWDFANGTYTITTTVA